ncbi:hypothetical protein VTN96DRAFT_5736 [Rasamsonia emersonii]|uniref:DUF967 domain protein n=1 Tax=Rasamsonia emersonii (strain ATCC 16479 / CBS 393.64 / IMI 116815) TaxID=1408163 RepID=A0A0F4YT31_RASE3|nr:hypothetical protein T310_4526 [Rasamsonia emersonii CBS 393.64]KKA21447.1 hypothetical protein T310_4526 [Rasamsonia emersonii CBS 393.64]
MAASQQPLGVPLTDPAQLAAYESSPAAIFPSFTADTAWSLGLALRARILSLPDGRRKPALISIALTTGSQQPHVVFQSATESGTVPDNEVWVRRKRNTVLRWGMSTWLLRRKMLSATTDVDQVEAAFVKKYALPSSNGGSVADDYAIHGGGFPIRVRGVDGLVGVIVVSGLKQEDDHQVIVEVVKDFIEGGQ